MVMVPKMVLPLYQNMIDLFLLEGLRTSPFRGQQSYKPQPLAVVVDSRRGGIEGGSQILSRAEVPKGW
jgi:hypothetical protein